MHDLYHLNCTDCKLSVRDISGTPKRLCKKKRISDAVMPKHCCVEKIVLNSIDAELALYQKLEFTVSEKHIDLRL